MPEQGGDGLLSRSDVKAALDAANLDSETVKPTTSDGTPAAGADPTVQPFDEVAAAMAEAVAAEQTAANAAAPAIPAAAPASSRPFDIPELPPGTLAPPAAHSLDLLRDVDLNVKIELGRSKMLVEDVLRLGEGSVVELDKLAGDPVDVLVNDRLVARGEVLVLNDNFCVRINDIISRDVGQEEVA